MLISEYILKQEMELSKQEIELFLHLQTSDQKKILTENVISSPISSTLIKKLLWEHYVHLTGFQNKLKIFLKQETELFKHEMELFTHFCSPDQKASFGTLHSFEPRI